MIPEPECKYGYTNAQLRELIPDREAFNRWMRGKTYAICSSAGMCKAGHGQVYYTNDVGQFLRYWYSTNPKTELINR